MRKYIAELIGTFAIVFCGTGAILATLTWNFLYKQQD
jgi:glycerol uptake facilitator-like aquaporin